MDEPASPEIRDHFDSPRNVGSLREDVDVGTGVAGRAEDGAMLRLQLRIRDGRISETRFKAFGCGWTIASGSFASEYIRGRSPSSARGLRSEEIAAELKLPKNKLHCAQLAIDALHAALDDQRTKAAGESSDAAGPT